MSDRVEPIAIDFGEGGTIRAVYPLKAARLYPAGTRALMVPWTDRSEASHRHEFAWLKEAWDQLPEALADEMPTPEHLRKRALIATGFYHETLIDVGNTTAALRVAMHLRGKDDFAHVVTRGGLVVIREAKSQAKSGPHRMDPATFQASKTAILEWVAVQIGVTPDTLQREAGRAA